MTLFSGEKDREEHYRNFEKLLQKAKELQREIQPKEGRVNFVKEKLQFVAYSFTSEGIKPEPMKIEAVISCKEAKSKEVRNFLRMTGYLDNFFKELYNTESCTAEKLNKEQNKIQMEEQRKT